MVGRAHLRQVGGWRQVSIVITQHRHSREAVELVHAWQELLGQGDLAASLEMLASRIEVNVPAPPTRRRVAGS